MKTAVIDVGSNSVRLMLVEGDKKSKFLSTTQLGRGIDKTGVLNDDAISDTLSAIIDYSKLGDVVYVFATEAVRVAKNGEQFCRLVKDKIGVDVDVLTKDEEARAGFLGATRGASGASIIDIGGASTEFARLKEERFESISIPLGAVRLTDRYNDGFDTDSYVDAILPKFDFTDKVFGIGGTITSSALMLEGLDRYDSAKIQGYQLKLNKLKCLVGLLSGLSGEEIYLKYPVIGQKRAKVIFEGTKLLLKIMEKYHLDTLTVSDSDNTEGYLMLRNL